MRTLDTIALFLLLATAPLAQSEVFVPPVYQSLDAPSLGRFAGFTQRSRQQILVDRSYLSVVQNRTLTSLTLRRDGSYRGALGAGAVDLTLFVSESIVDPEQARMSLPLNRTAPRTLVFQGRVNLPASPALTSPNDPTWSAPYTVHVPFTQGFAYGNAHLVLDVDGAPVGGSSSAWWPIDQALDASTGSVVSVGIGCGRFNRASASRSQLVIGGSLRLLASGEPGSLAVPMIGADASLAWDMSFLGATGCTLRVDPAVTFAAAYAAAADPRQPGIAELELQIPHQPSLLGSRLAVQWLDFQRALPPQRWSNSAGMTFSNALELTLSACSRAVLGTMIEVGVYPMGALPDVGLVMPCRLPVMRFGVQ